MELVRQRLDEFCGRGASGTCVISSPVPTSCFSQPCVMGIDEAGRGPVLGPMVYACAYCPSGFEQQLSQLGCADSKTLTAEKREQLFERLQQPSQTEDGSEKTEQRSSDNVGWQVEVLSPTFISQNMFRRCKYNLNWMSHDAAIGLVQRCLDAGVHVDHVFVDTVGPPDKYQAKLEARFPRLKFTVAKKADSLYSTVSAASICAKVVRDTALADWHSTDTVNSDGTRLDMTTLGSGYPADPVTKKFLSDNLDPVFGYPSVVRFSWSTCTNLLEKSAVPVQWEDDNDDASSAGGKSGARSVASFFNTTNKKGHAFFVERCLFPCSEL